MKNTKEFKPYTSITYQAEALKSLSIKRYKITDELRKAKLTLYNLVQLTFPKYLNLFSNIYQESAMEILSKYICPLTISKTRPTSIAKLIHGKCKCSASDVIDAAKNTIGIWNPCYAVELKDAIDNIKHCQSRIDKIDIEIKKCVDAITPNILTVPGVGYTTAGIILGEIRDISKFHSTESLIAYSGIDLEVNDSENRFSTNLRASKKGSVYLRYALYQVAKVAWMYNPVLNAYYEKKKTEGKHYYVILGHLEKKLIRIIYSI